MFLPFSNRAKAWEPTALGLRRLSGVRDGNLLDPWELAPKVGLLVVNANDFLSLLNADQRSHLLDGGSRQWSGGVYPVPLEDGSRICMVNPAHSHRRNKITLMEEISHVHLGHEPTRLVFDGNRVEVRDFNSLQEEEAYGVGAAALLPWSPFFRCLDEGEKMAQIAERYDVTEQLVRYRVNITGAYRLYQARQRIQCR